MEHKPIKVLMLGWEFPPLLTGGLGQACHGLFQALSEFTELTVIIPRSDKSVKLKQGSIIGLNKLGLDAEEEQEIVPMEAFAQVAYIDSNLDPYPHKGNSYNSVKSLPIEDLDQIRNMYNTQETYGPNILEKVATYAEMVTHLASTLKFDIIHAHDWITFPAALKIKELTGKPLVVHIHSLETDRVGADARNDVYEIELAAMLAADRVIPVSQFTKTCIIANYGIDAGKISPVYNAIAPMESFREVKTISEKIIAFVGRITYQKGPELMIETAERLATKMTNFKFVIAGTGDRLKDIIRLSAEKGLSDKFIFTGFLSREYVNKLFAQADVYFMPSVSEPFGLSALEATQFEIPCVLSNQSGVSEILPSVLKADYWDVDKMANYLYALLNYDGIRDHLIGKSKVSMQKMSWSNSATQVVEIYKQLL